MGFSIGFGFFGVNFQVLIPTHWFGQTAFCPNRKAMPDDHFMSGGCYSGHTLSTLVSTQFACTDSLHTSKKSVLNSLARNLQRNNDAFAAAEWLGDPTDCSVGGNSFPVAIAFTVAIARRSSRQPFSASSWEKKRMQKGWMWGALKMKPMASPETG